MFDFSSFPLIDSKRLRLRAFVNTDCSAIFAIRSDFEVTKYNSGPAYTDISQAQSMVDRTIAGFAQKTSLYWIISLRETEEVIGQLGYNAWDHDNYSAEIGFDLRRDFWGKGIMKEAIDAVLYFGIKYMDLNRVSAQVSSYNVQCKHLLTRVGFQHEGTQREQYFEDDKFHDLDLFAILKKEYSKEIVESSCVVTFVPVD